MNRFAAGLLPVVVLAITMGCPPPPPPPPPPPNPPNVFLTMDESNVIGDAVRGKVNVSGCKTVAQVQLLQGDTDAFVMDLNFTTSPTSFTVTPGFFSTLYPRTGIAAALTLKAKVVCDDGRTRTSQPVGVSFFPIASRYKTPTGEQIVTDNFVAEGGLGGTPTTFLGCALTSTGTELVRVNLAGEPIAFNNTLPFDCSLATEISERSTVTGTRWVLEPGQGAYAINSALQIQRVFTSVKTMRMGVGKKGSAVLWVDEGGTRNRIVKLDPVPSSTNEWEAEFVGIMNSNPLIDDGAGNSVWVTRWLFDIGTKRADIIPWQYDLNNGTVRNGVVNGLPAVIYTQQYPNNEASQPIMPEGVFSADGAFFTFPVISLSAQSSVIVSCSTGPGLCAGSAQHWITNPFPGILRAVVPFSNGNLYAAIGPYAVYFLSGQLGTVQNLQEVPLGPAGSQVVVGVQPGGGTDFYIMTGPDFGPGVGSGATEIIATEAPSAGELWRLTWGTGESSGNSMYIGVDDAQQVWIRVGTDLIKPLSNFDYRMARGPTVIP